MNQRCHRRTVKPAGPTEGGDMSSDPRELEGAFPRRNHDHLRCVAEAMSDAVSLCRARRVRLTPLRSRVLEIVWQNHKPLGAYDILAVLAEEGRSAAPPTVYRALEFLLMASDVTRGGEGYLALTYLSGNAFSDPVLEQRAFVEARRSLGWSDNL